jgi:hypothetical protein
MVAGGANRSPNALILSLNSRIRVVYEKNKGFRELFRASLEFLPDSDPVLFNIVDLVPLSD